VAWSRVRAAEAVDSYARQVLVRTFIDESRKRRNHEVATAELPESGAESPEIDLDFEARLWGSYLGEVLRQRYAGSWEMTQYPGGEHAVPAVDVRGSRLFPLMKVHRRLTIGEEEDLPGFFTMVTARLGNPAKVN